MVWLIAGYSGDFDPVVPCMNHAIFLLYYTMELYSGIMVFSPSFILCSSLGI